MKSSNELMLIWSLAVKLQIPLFKKETLLVAGGGNGIGLGLWVG